MKQSSMERTRSSLLKPNRKHRESVMRAYGHQSKIISVYQSSYPKPRLGGDMPSLWIMLLVAQANPAMPWEGAAQVWTPRSNDHREPCQRPATAACSLAPHSSHPTNDITSPWKPHPFAGSAGSPESCHLHQCSCLGGSSGIASWAEFPLTWRHRRLKTHVLPRLS